MSEVNAGRKSTSHSGFEWAGTVARLRRNGKTSRAGRRSALLSLLSSTYVNSRAGRAVETRGTTDRG